MLTSFRDLDFYRDAYELSLEMHRLSLTFPAFELHELGGQVRRASKGIPQNIAEGWARRESEKEFKHFLLIAIGSCEEMQVQLDLSRDLNYIPTEAHADYIARYVSILKRLCRFRSRWQSY